MNLTAPKASTLELSVEILERDSDWPDLGQVSTHDPVSYDQKGEVT